MARPLEDFDVVVVGARCAGSPLATMLARRGLRVCLLDRARFPSDTLSTHLIQPRGVAALDRLGVLDTVLAAGAMPIRNFTFAIDDVRVDAKIDAAAFGAPALNLRRVTLDHLLVDAATAAGADVRTATAATALHCEDGRVAGVETKRSRLRARLVVGADGRSSTVAGLVGAAEYNVAPPGRMFAWAYFEGARENEGRLRLGSAGELTFVASPTDSGLYLAAACPPMQTKEAFLANRESNFMAAIDAWPELAAVLAEANRVGPIRVLANWHGYFREAAGPGWALLGDAGHFKDPSPAQGIADALNQAEHLADAIELGLDGTVVIDDALRRWWRWRDEDCFEMHWFATDMGAPSSQTPLASQFARDMTGDEKAMESLLRVLNRDARPSRLLTPARLGRAGVRAVRNQPNRIPAMMKEVASEIHNQIDRSQQRRRSPARGTLPPEERRTERLLLALTVIGFVVPNVFVGVYLADADFDLAGYFSLWTASTPSTQLLVDLAIAALAFFIWAAFDGPRARIKRWWLCIPASLLVGLCFGLPLYLLMRERALARTGGRTAG
jgi:menaquinone-9 beta-reductase